MKYSTALRRIAWNTGTDSDGACVLPPRRLAPTGYTRFEPITASRVRLFIPEVKSDTPSIAEFAVLDSSGVNLAGTNSQTVRTFRTFVNRNSNGGVAWFIENPTTAALQQTVNEAMPNPDVKWNKPPTVQGGHLCYLHKVIDGHDFWFFTNSSDTPVDTSVCLRGVHVLERWDPHTGQIETQRMTTSDKSTCVQLRLAPVTSVFLVNRTGDARR